MSTLGEVLFLYLHAILTIRRIMKNNQSGYGLVEGLLILLVLSVIGFGGYYVWNQNSEKEQLQTSQSETTESESDETKSTESFVLPDNWKTVSENGITLSYPIAWDNTDEEYQRLKVNGLLEGNRIYVGFGAPYGYEYVEGNTWKNVSSVEGEDAWNKPPTNADVNVKGSSSTIILSSGDGGCSGSKIGFAYSGKLYSVSLPWECDDETHGSAGIDSEVVARDLDKVISSIIVN